ncbi:hypothetical protein BH11ARM2_BH11ARM2_36390 [soil metagenome]
MPLILWRPAILPYTKNADLFEHRTGEAPYILAHRATLIGKKLIAVQEPEQTALLLDVTESSDPFVAELPALAFRKKRNDEEGLAMLAHVDGSVKRIKRAALAEVR